MPMQRYNGSGLIFFSVISQKSQFCNLRLKCFHQIVIVQLMCLVVLKMLQHHQLAGYRTDVIWHGSHDPSEEPQ